MEVKIVRYILIVLIALVITSCSRTQPGSTTILIVRHAEKASDAEDSPLTEDGVKRSQALVDVTADANVSAIYTTQFKRNLETARPLSERLGIPITEVPVNLQNPGDYGKTLAKTILEKHTGQTILVVGHGNTIGSIVAGLIGRDARLGDIQYSDFFIVTIQPSGTAKVIRAQYGTGTTGNIMMMK
jgi:2,3-bisphosphoglycerate-dependent phosphoglycerate mutase